MTTEDLATGGAQPETAATTAAPETGKVETTADEAKATDAATAEQGKQPDPVKTEEQQAAEASEAAKTLNERKQRAKERVEQAVTRQREAERRAEKAERDLAQLRKTMKAPVPNEYTDPATLTADTVNHTMDQRRAAELETTHQEASTEALNERMFAFRDRVSEHKTTLEDPAAFDKAVEALSPYLSQETTEMIADIDDGPAIIQQLGTNLAEARRLEKMPARARAFELGKIAAQITAKPLPRVTTAPNPVSAVGGRSAGAQPKFGSMNYEEYRQEVAKEMKR